MKRSILLIPALILLLTTGCKFFEELGNPYPTDAELEKRFNDNREAFDELVQMFKENAELWEIDADGKALLDFGKPTSLPQARADRYRELMKQTGILNINRLHPSVGQPPSPTIYMRVWLVPNMVIGTKSKLYVYKSWHQKNVVESLDKIYAGGDDAGHYKKINDDWSLFLDVW